MRHHGNGPEISTDVINLLFVLAGISLACIIPCYLSLRYFCRNGGDKWTRRLRLSIIFTSVLPVVNMIIVFIFLFSGMFMLYEYMLDDLFSSYKQKLKAYLDKEVWW